MEREGPEVAVRLIRSIRSLAYNRKLQPLVEDRIERSEASLRGYLLANGLTTTRVGPYQMDMDEEGGISLARLPVDNWQQLPMPKVDGSEEPFSASDGTGDLASFDDGERLLVQDVSSLTGASGRSP